MRRPFAFCYALTIGLLLLAGAACGSDSSDESPAPTTTAQASSPAASPTEESTPAPLTSPYAAALLQESELPAGFKERQREGRRLTSRDFPGLTTGGDSVFGTWLSADTNEFINQFVIAPDDPATAPALLDALNADSYRTLLGGGATGIQVTEKAIPGAPAGAKGLTYSGRGLGGRDLTGDAIAFTSNGAYVVIVNGRYKQPGAGIDLGALATAVSQRLATVRR